MKEQIIRRQTEILIAMLEMTRHRTMGEGVPADRVLAGFFRQRRELGSRDRRFLSEAIFSWFRWRGWTEPLALSGLEAVALSRILDEAELHPALASVARPEWTLPAGALLREKAERLAGWFPDAISPQPEELVPAGAVERIAVDAGEEIRFLEAIQRRPPTWLRIRSRDVLEKLDKAGIAFTEHERLAGAIAIEGGAPLAALGQTGQMLIQDLASQVVGEIADPQPGSTWWDACCGAGGKALHLADKAGADGQIIATDVRTSALQECRKRARVAGIATVRTQPHDLATGPMGRSVDGVLVDAPCSGWGTWSRNPDARWRSDPRDPQQKRNLQVRLLTQAAAAVCEGGRLVYAVCTVTREETGEVVARFLEACPAFQLDPFLDPLSGRGTDGTLHIRPWAGPCDGMFVARFSR